ncbi:MAG: hypothetical protein JXR59_09885 [Desulfuromonadaceae bacterium]|nr:hypothetical protein [Desulfuromonadaceae bacterium]
MEWLKPFETNQIVNTIHELDLLHNGWFIAGAVLFVVICLLMKWRMLLSCVLSITALVTLVYYVNGGNKNLEQSSDSLFLFVGGGAAIVFFLIYMVFFRSD